jgi:hypothetical protein
MRTLLVIAFLSAVTVSTFAEVADKSRVELYRAGPKELTPETRSGVVGWGEKLLKSANFNTVNQPDILKQSVTDIQKRYRDTLRGDYLVVSYDRPTKFRTVASDVTVVEIVVGLNRRDRFASGLFTVDPDGRVVAHEKYAAISLPTQLAPGASARDAH